MTVIKTRDWTGGKRGYHDAFHGTSWDHGAGFSDELKNNWVELVRRPKPRARPLDQDMLADEMELFYPLGIADACGGC